jgi:hypothetical protein
MWADLTIDRYDVLSTTVAGSAQGTPMTDPSDEIRARLSSIIARLSPLAHGTGTLDANNIRTAIVVIEHEVSLIMAALRRLPTAGGQQP